MLSLTAKKQIHITLCARASAVGAIFFFWLRGVCVSVHGLFVALHRLSLVAASRGYSPIAVCRLLTEVASLVKEHKL